MNVNDNRYNRHIVQLFYHDQTMAAEMTQIQTRDLLQQKQSCVFRREVGKIGVGTIATLRR